MALLQAGHFQTTHFPSRHWQTNPQCWPEYGAVAPPSQKGAGAEYWLKPHVRVRHRPELLALIKDYLRLKQDD